MRNSRPGSKHLKQQGNAVTPQENVVSEADSSIVKGRDGVDVVPAVAAPVSTGRPEKSEELKEPLAMPIATVPELEELRRITRVQIAGGVMQVIVNLLDDSDFPVRTTTVSDGFDQQGRPVPFALKGMKPSDFEDLRRRIMEAVERIMESVYDRLAKLETEGTAREEYAKRLQSYRSRTDGATEKNGAGSGYNKK